MPEIHVITGPMGAAKSYRAIELAFQLTYQGYHVIVFSTVPYSTAQYSHVKSRNFAQFQCEVIPKELDYQEFIEFVLGKFSLQTTDKTISLHGKCVIIDEAQFLRGEIAHALVWLHERGLDVIVSGLNRDFFGRPFGLIAAIMPYADYIEVRRAVCDECKRHNATNTIRITKEEDLIVLDPKAYRSVCNECLRRKSD